MEHPREYDEWLAQLAASRAQVLARAKAHTVDTAALRHVADTEAGLALTLRLVPIDPIAHLKAAHTYARSYLQRLAGRDLAVVSTVEDRIYTSRKVLRRVLDHALDHLNQIGQWLAWKEQGVTPVPTDGWASSADTLEEDHVALSAADLAAWLWRIDLAAQMLIQRAEGLSTAQLVWVPPDGRWSLRQVLHHVASAEVFYAISIDEALPEDATARYIEANRRLTERLNEHAELSADGDLACFDDGTVVPVEQLVRSALAEERTLRET